MSTSTGLGLTAAIVARNSAQPTRRAVLHVQAPGDPAPSADLASWFTERAFHFYVGDVRLRPAARLTGRRASRDLNGAVEDVDAACSRLRDADGMKSVVVTAHGRTAVAAALWSQSRKAADALILSAPAWPRRSLRLHIACPVLVVATEPSSASAAARSRLRLRRRGRAVAPPYLGSHVTWLALAEAGPERRPFLDELGRWLGAYMYGSARDQLL